MISYIDRKSGEVKQENVYGGEILEFLYGDSWWGARCSHLLAKSPCFSKFYGWLQRRAASKKKILPFIKKYHVDASEFEEPPHSFPSFDAFFSRKLKKEARPISPGKSILTCPADGRYSFYPNLSKLSKIPVKGKELPLESLLGDRELANRFTGGSLIIARLCPTDYHRFHFPCRCTPETSLSLPGPLYSVNPIAIKKNFSILSSNKRNLTLCHSFDFDTFCYLEVGATCVGTIHQTFQPQKEVDKGEEKGFFSFGGSVVMLLFQPKKIVIDPDLLNKTCEVFCQMGDHFGKKM